MEPKRGRGRARASSEAEGGAAKGGLDGADRAASGATSHRDSDLRGQNFRGQDLEKACFDGADLTGADFRDADLRNASFKDARGLSSHALGGADLTGATLPDGVAGFDGLGAVAEVSRYIQTLYQIILAISSFAVLTVLSVRDENMILHHALPTTVLPFIQASVSARMFGWAMPLILFLVFFYQLLYYGKLWRQLADLPAVFPDGTPLDKKAYTLTTNCLIRLHSRRLHRAEEAGALRRERDRSILIVHGPVVYTLFLFWLSFLKEHSWPYSLIRIALFAAAVCLTYYAHGIMARRLLSREAHAPGDASRTRDVRRLFVLAAVLALSTLAVTAGAIHYSRRLLPAPWNRFFFTDISNRRISSGDQDSAPGAAAKHGDGLDSVVGADLSRANLRGMYAFRAFLPKSDLRHADLRHAFLVLADLRQSRLNNARLDGADLRGADLRGAFLRGAHVDTYTVFFGGHDPDLPVRNGANLKDAHLEGIVPEDIDDDGLGENDWEAFCKRVSQARNYQLAYYDPDALMALHISSEAAVATTDGIPQHSLNLKSKKLRGYSFKKNQMQLTDFDTYDFQGAGFQEAALWGSTFRDCNLRDVDFSGAQAEEVDFQGAHLAGANLAGVNLRGANFKGVDLSAVKNLRREQMEVAIWDRDTRFPDPETHRGKPGENDSLELLRLRQESFPDAPAKAVK